MAVGGPVGASTAFDAIGESVEHTRSRLFPFDFRVWVTLGFAAFLEQCGRQGSPGSSFRFPGGGGSGGGGGGGSTPSFMEWLQSNLLVVLAIAAGIIILVVALSALATWLSSRGTFVYIDCVVTGRAEIVRPWKQHAEVAWSHFWWRFLLGVATLLLVLLVIAPVILVALRTNPEENPVPLIVAVVVALPFVLVVAIGGSLLDGLMRNVVAPLQLHGGLLCGAALARSLGLVRAHPLAFLVFVLVKFVLSMLIAGVSILLCCVTCCAVIIPVVLQVLAQPVFFFERAYSLFFLRRLGYDLFAFGAGEADTVQEALPPVI